MACQSSKRIKIREKREEREERSNLVWSKLVEITLKSYSSENWITNGVAWGFKDYDS